MIAATDRDPERLDESAREELCLLLNAEPGRRVLEVVDGRTLGQAVEAHAPNHPHLSIRPFGSRLYSIEAGA